MEAGPAPRPGHVTLVPRAGACLGCVKRSDAQADLFGDANGASCLDGGCFAGKLKAFTKRKEADLLEKHPEAVKVSTSYGAGPKGSLSLNDVKPAKKGDKGAVAALEYGPGGKVSLTFVKVKKEAKEPTEKDLAKVEAKRREARIRALALEKLVAIVEDLDTEFHKDAKPSSAWCTASALRSRRRSSGSAPSRRSRSPLRKCGRPLPSAWSAS